MVTIITTHLRKEKRGKTLIKRFLPLMFLVSLASFAQRSQDLAYQLRLIQVLLPEATRLGFIYNPEDTSAELDLNAAVNQTGLRVFKYPISSVRDLTKCVRTLMNRYEVDFIYVFDDSLLSSQNALKIMVKQTQRKGIPVFTLSQNILGAGGYAQLFNDNGQWRMRIVSQTSGNYSISVPPNDDRFIIQ